MKLNLGCGKNILDGWVNADRPVDGHIPDGTIAIDLEKHLPWKTDTADEMLLSHVIEHIPNTLHMMEELWRVGKPGCKLTIRCPYGSSDDAWEDPTHVRPYFIGSFYPFAQTYYWRADYGFRGDWQVKKIILAVRKQLVEQAKRSEEQVMQWVMMHRNIVTEMVAELVAVKPARAQKRELQEAPEIKLMAV
jgi:SAM-dependent methyltransferase